MRWCGLALLAVRSSAFIHPSPLPAHWFLPSTPRSYRLPSRRKYLDPNVNASPDRTVGAPRRLVQRFARRFAFRKRGLPRSNAWMVQSGTKNIAVLQLIVEASLVACAICITSFHFFGRLSQKFVITNLSRWMAATLLVRLLMMHSSVTSSTPSLARGEGSDWFLQGSYRVILRDEEGNENPSAGEKEQGGSTVPSSVPVRIRQVPGNGSCLFLAIAAGVLSEQSASRHCQDETGGIHAMTHPPMSKVIAYSSELRSLAVDTLENGIEGNSTQMEGVSPQQLIMESDETISASSLVEKAADQYGISPEKYLSDMRRDAWGGGPEIVALANRLHRQIVLLEPANSEEHYREDEDKQSIYLMMVARFGHPSSDRSPVYILSTNHNFPKEYQGKKGNHFLAVFPLQPL